MKPRFDLITITSLTFYVPETFITRWQHADGSELANAQSIVREFCELLDMPVSVNDLSFWHDPDVQ